MNNQGERSSRGLTSLQTFTSALSDIRSSDSLLEFSTIVSNDASASAARSTAALSCGQEDVGFRFQDIRSRKSRFRQDFTSRQEQ